MWTCATGGGRGRLGGMAEGKICTASRDEIVRTEPPPRKRDVVAPSNSRKQERRAHLMTPWEAPPRGASMCTYAPPEEMDKDDRGGDMAEGKLCTGSRDEVIKTLLQEAGRGPAKGTGAPGLFDVHLGKRRVELCTPGPLQYPKARAARWAHKTVMRQ